MVAMTPSLTPSACYCGNHISSLQNATATTASHLSQSNDAPVVCCHECAIQLLASKTSRYQSALEHRDQTKVECTNRLSKTRLVHHQRPTRRRHSDYLENDDEKYDGIAADRQHINDDESNSSSSYSTPLPDPNHLHHQASLLKQRLTILRAHTNKLALRVTAKTMENDERQERLQDNASKVTLAQERLHQMRMCLLMQSEQMVEPNNTDNHNNDGDSSNVTDGNNNNHNGSIHYQEGVGGGLTDALYSNTHEIQSLRFHMACKVFDMHRLDVGEQFTSNATSTSTATTTTPPQQEKTASGVGKISGLPLPHAGPVLYGVIPPEVLSSSLRLVASLTQLVSCCLGVVLPHPILVYSMECRACERMYDGYGGDIIDASMMDEYDGDDDDQGGQFNLCSACQSNGSTNNDSCTMMQNPHRDKTMTLSSSISSSSSSSTSITQTSKSSLLSLVGSSARRAISLTATVTSRAISHMQPSSTAIASDLPSDHIRQHPIPMQNRGNPRSQFQRGEGGLNQNFLATTITRRIHYASYACLRENHDTSATEYVLNPPRWGGGEAGTSISKTSGGDTIQGPGGHNGKVANGTTTQQSTTYATRDEFHDAEERFATGLQLLQNDIVALCFRSGVDVSSLWPAESVLLNLQALWCHCRNLSRVGTRKD
jgi:hypothetical protein